MKQKKLLAAGLCILLGLTGCQTAARRGNRPRHRHRGGGVAGPGGGLLGGQHQPKYPPDVTAAGASRQKALSLQLANPVSTRRGPLWGLRLSLWVAGENHCKPLGKGSITNGNFTNPLGVFILKADQGKTQQRRAPKEPLGKDCVR